MRVSRVKHDRRELEALKTLDHAMVAIDDKDAQTVLLAAVLALTYYYPSDREQALRDGIAVLRGTV